MPRAPRQCPTPGCTTPITTTRYCPTHTTHHWDRPGNQRGTGHGKWRREVLARDKGTCQIRGPHCTRRATEADHIINIAEGGAAYDLTNGQAACATCHKAKTQQEAARGRQRAAQQRG